MASPPTRSERGRAETISSEQTPTQWQQSTASTQLPENLEPSQSHIRPGIDVTHESKDSPDKLLVRFLRGNETYEVEQPSDPQEARRTSQRVLREILADERWDRRMVEDFYKEINPSVRGLQSCLTPYPFHRTLYLILLNALEDKEKSMKEKESTSREAADFDQAELATLEDQARNRIVQTLADH